ncbi:MAG: hypothetical protein Q9M36_10610 [Sulfurovum sp.]|nr:hypothetical protein [Sulfurovum sp.]
MLIILAIFSTHPLLIYPFDIYTHLQWIDEQSFSTDAPSTRYMWHYIWSNIFDFLYITNQDILLRAYIIHYTQFILTFIIIFYVSRTFIQNLFTPISTTLLNDVALWSSLVWFTLLSTYSVNHHEIWIVWYSVNYQISLVFTLFILAMSISLIFETLSLSKKIFYILMILGFSYIIIRIHAMEYIYYMMYLGVLLLIHIDIILKWFKTHIYIAFAMLILSSISIWQLAPYLQHYIYAKSKLLSYLSWDRLPLLLDEIEKHGDTILSHYNKASTTLNTFIYLSLFLILVFGFILLYKSYKKSLLHINIRLVLFIFMSSLFILIPLFQYSAGLAGLLTYDTVSHRFYFSSLLFLIVPSFVLYIMFSFKTSKLYIFHTSMIVIFMTTLLYSKHLSANSNYYKNIRSFTHMFIQDKRAFNLNSAQIVAIGAQLNAYQTQHTQSKALYYYARDDIAFVIKFIYRKPVLYQRRGSKDYQKSFQQHSDKNAHAILFEIPKAFPPYQRYISRPALQ